MAVLINTELSNTVIKAHISLQKDKILDWTKLKTFDDNKSNATEMFGFAFVKVEQN